MPFPNDYTFFAISADWVAAAEATDFQRIPDEIIHVKAGQRMGEFQNRSSNPGEA
jgi:hypothetical protein